MASSESYMCKHRCKNLFVWMSRLIFWLGVTHLMTACRYQAIEEELELSLSQEESNSELDSVIPDLKTCMGQCAETGDPLFPINDTGVTTYWNNNDISEACATASTLAQDCHHGRDNHSEINKQGYGIAGFDFNKLDSDGVSLPLDADEWDCVVDHTTGLTWEIKLKNNEERDVVWRMV